LIERQELTFLDADKTSRNCTAISLTGTTQRTLDALLPQYISTVDSGNLAGHLVAVKQANIELTRLGTL
jgi:cyclic beta-1,2-glucan synthetase